MPDKILTREFLAKYRNKQPEWGFGGLGYIVYKRTYARPKDDGTTEEWWETVTRCIRGAQKIGAGYTQKEAEELYDLIFNLKCNFAGRMLWQLGTDTVDKFGGNSLLNCWYVAIRSIDDFCFLFENLMLGGGVGFSVKSEDIHELPRVKKDVFVTHQCTKDANFIVPDSREGWILLLRQILKAYFLTGKSFTYSTIIVRGAGELIKGFGGTASGPGPLVEGMQRIVEICRSREGKKLRSLDVLDICNIIGSIVVAGNVRRSAEIALGDPDDYLFLRAKRWDLGNIPNHRAMSNNTIFADKYSHIMNDVWEGYNGNGEPYGFFNLPLSQKVGRLKDVLKDKDNCEGLNPSMSAGTLVLTRKGIIPIEQLENKTFETKNLNGIWVPAKCALSSESAEVWQVNLGKEKNLYATREHRWIVLNPSGEYVKKYTRELKAGDLIPQPCNQPLGIEGQYNFTEDEGYLIGTLVGDGWLGKTKAGDLYGGAIFCKDEVEVADRFINILNSKKKYPSHLIECPNINAIQTQFGADELCNQLITKYGLSLEDKAIPKTVWESNDTYIRGFIDGLFSTDGSVYTDEKRGFKNGYISLTTSRKHIAVDLIKLLSFFGITALFGHYEHKNPKFTNGKQYNKNYQQYTVRITKGFIKAFAHLFPLTCKHKQEKIERILANTKPAKRKEQNYARINWVANSDYQKVWDVTVYDEMHVFPVQYGYTGNCGEVTLSNYECCNLAELYLNRISSKDELIKCASLLYKTQKAVAALPFLHEETNKIVHKNMRLGMGVTGVCQSLDKLDWLDDCYKALRKLDKQWSKERGWEESIKLTTIKPSGTNSLLAGSTPGVHPGYCHYFIRRVRMASTDKLVNACRDLGYKVEYARNFDGSEDYKTAIVEFPCKFDERTLVAKQMNAVTQLDLVKKLQTLWADNAVSVTVYYKKEEIPAIKAWLKEHYEDGIKSVSFLLHSDHGFVQSPYEEITEEQYKELIKYLKPINFGKLTIHGNELEGIECTGGACPIK